MSDVASAAEELESGLDWISAIAPGAGLAFRALVTATVDDGRETPSPKARALLSLALATAGRCECCVERHTRAAAKAGATRAEIIATLQRAILMADGPATVYGAQALAAFDTLAPETDAVRPAPARLDRAA